MVELPVLPQPELIRPELTRVLASDGFLRSEKLTRLLLLLVEKAIAGQEHEFDTTTDPEARMDAHRLRQRLQEYYEGPGARNPYRLVLPKGGNTLVFEPVTPVAAKGNFDSSSAPKPTPSTGNRIPARWAWFAAGAAMAALIALGWFRYSTPHPSSRIQSLAILPFSNLTGDPSRAELCDGLAEELIDRAARIPTLRVVARSTAFQFRGQSYDLSALARRLQVDAIIEGAVRQNAKELQINVQMVKASDGFPIFSETYRLPDQHPVLLQERIGQMVELRVVGLLPGVTLPGLPAALQDLEVRSLVTRASHLAERRTAESLQSAIADSQEAIRRQPQHALAYAVLADALFSYLDFRPPTEWPNILERAERAARDAMSRSTELAGPYATLAAIKMNYSWDFRDAEQQFRKAIEINPSHSSARTRYSRLLTILGRSREALDQAQMARLIDPLSVNAVANAGHVLYFSRQYSQALEPLTSALELDARYRNGHLTMARVLALLGRFPEARSHVASARQFTEDGEYVTCAAYVEALAGNRDEARKLLDSLSSRPQGTPPASISLAASWAAIGEREKAVKIIDDAVHARDPNVIYMAVSPSMDPLRNIPRFAELIRAVRVQ